MITWVQQVTISSLSRYVGDLFSKEVISTASNESLKHSVTIVCLR